MHSKATIASATMDIALNKLKAAHRPMSAGPARGRARGVRREHRAAHGLSSRSWSSQRNGEGEEDGLVSSSRRRASAEALRISQRRRSKSEPIPSPDGVDDASPRRSALPRT